VTRRRGVTALAAFVLGAWVLGGTGAVADELELEVEIPALASEAFDVEDAQLRWGINEETGAGAFAGGCNFLSAGTTPDTGGSRVWTDEDGYFRTSQGAVRIERPVVTSTGTRYRPVTFAERCRDAEGRTVSPSRTRGTGIQAVLEGGEGHVDPETGEARIAWHGSVSVVLYGGMTYWWFTDPVLEVSGGRGTLTATAGGFGTSREDTSSWEPLAEETIVLAELPSVSLCGDKGFTALPAYRGVEVELPAGAPSQRRSGEAWGSFPQSFVDFHEGTGQQAFWYSSGGARDAAKPATALVVSYDAAEPTDPVEPEPVEDEPVEGDDEPVNPVRPRPAPPGPPAPAPVLAPAGTQAPAPSPVPATTVLPLAAGPDDDGALLAATGGAPVPWSLALAVLVAGAALTVLGYRAHWLVWPTRRGRP